MSDGGRPVVVVTRRLPAAVEREVAERYDARLNERDEPLDAAALAAALRDADALLCTVTDRVDESVQGPSARTWPASTRAPSSTMGFWLTQVPWLLRRNFSSR